MTKNPAYVSDILCSAKQIVRMNIHDEQSIVETLLAGCKSYQFNRTISTVPRKKSMEKLHHWQAIGLPVLRYKYKIFTMKCQNPLQQFPCSKSLVSQTVL